MATYIVTFEINDSGRKAKLIEKLKEFGVYCPIHGNAWAIKTEKNPTEIYYTVSPLLLPVDRIFIMRSGTLAAWQNSYGVEYTEWLKKHL